MWGMNVNKYEVNWNRETKIIMCAIIFNIKYDDQQLQGNDLKLPVQTTEDLLLWVGEKKHFFIHFPLD